MVACRLAPSGPSKSVSRALAKAASKFPSLDSNEAFGDDATNGGGGIFNNGGIVNVLGAETMISNNFACQGIFK